MGMEEEARWLVAVLALQQKLREREAVLKEQVEAGMRSGDRRSVVVVIEGDEVEIGAVTKTRPKVRPGGRVARVVDEAAFLAWARAVDPDWVEVSESVRPWARAEVVRGVESGDGGFFDPATGELLEVPPGVEVVDEPPATGKSVLQVRMTADAERFAQGVLARLGTLALPGGHEEVES